MVASPLAFQPIVEANVSGLGGKERIGPVELARACCRPRKPYRRSRRQGFYGTPLLGGYAVMMKASRPESHRGRQRQFEGIVDARSPGQIGRLQWSRTLRILGDAKPTMSNYFSTFRHPFAADLKKKFLDACRAEKLDYCIIVREMDNPTISFFASGRLLRAAG